MRDFFLSVGLVCLISGCGGGGATVSGKVTLDDGSAAPRGTVMLMSDTATFRGAIGSSGVYTIQDVAAGDYSVSVTGVTSEEANTDTDAGMTFDDETGEYTSEAPPPPESLIKDMYFNPTTSGLSITVPGGSYDLQLERAGGAEAPASTEG